MSIAELFDAKQIQRAQNFFAGRRQRRALKMSHTRPPKRQKILLEPLEPRLLLNAQPGLEPVLFIPGFGGTMAADTTDDGMEEWLTTRGIAPDKLQLEQLASTGDDLIQTLQNVGYSLDAADPGKPALYAVTWDWRTGVAPRDGEQDDALVEQDPGRER